MSLPSVSKPYTHVNGQKADGNKVNSNDDTVYGGLNDVIAVLNQAMGTKPTLDSRLDVSLNEDGTLRTGVTAGGEWINPQLSATYVSSTQFTVQGDQRDIYAQYRRLKIDGSFTEVQSSDYSAGTGLTTITTSDAVLADPISSVEHSVISPGSSSGITWKTILPQMTAFFMSLMDDPDASTALSTLGLTAFAKTLMDDPDASTALTTLGLTAFAKSLIDDPDAATARTTLGLADNMIRTITVGTAAPSGGADGDIHLRY